MSVSTLRLIRMKHVVFSTDVPKKTEKGTKISRRRKYLFVTRALRESRAERIPGESPGGKRSFSA